MLTIEARFMRSPADFEAAATDWMRVWGLHEVRTTAAGRDGGVDVESIEAVAQVKAWMVPVGSPEVQQLKGAAHDGRLPLFFSLMQYTRAAVKFADQAGVALFRFSGYNGEIEPVNECARNFLLDRSVTQHLPPLNYEGRHPVYELVGTCLQRVISHGSLPSDVWTESFAILHVKGVENRYVQFIFDELGLCVEAVSASVARPSLGPSEILQLEGLGWPPPEPAPDSENYRVTYKQPFPLPEIAELLTRTLVEVYGVPTTEDVDVTMELNDEVYPWSVPKAL